MNVVLTPELEELIDEQVARGAYLTALDVLRDALLLLKEQREPERPLAPQRVRVAGTLTMDPEDPACDARFELILDSGQRLKGDGSLVNNAGLRELDGLLVVVSGLAHFWPSGRVERLEAEEVEAAHGDVSLWAVEPRPLRAPWDPNLLDRPQTVESGLQAVFGKWPGDESDDEVFAALDALS